MPTYVTGDDTANEGKDIWNANDLEHDQRLDLLEAEVRIGGVAGIAPDADGGNIDFLDTTHVKIVKDLVLNTVKWSLNDVPIVVPLLANLRSYATAGLQQDDAALVLGGTSRGDGKENIFRWDAAVAPAFTALDSTDTFTVSSHPFTSGDAVKLYGSSLPGNTLTTGVYYIIVLSSTTFQLATTWDDALAATPVVRTITANGSGYVNFADDGAEKIVPDGNPQNGRWLSALAVSTGRPSVSVGSRLGTGGTVRLLPGSTDEAGTIEYFVGSSQPADGTYDDLFTFTPSRPYTRRKPIVIFSGADSLGSADVWSMASEYNLAGQGSWSAYSRFGSSGGTHRVNYMVVGN